MLGTVPCTTCADDEQSCDMHRQGIDCPDVRRWSRLPEDRITNHFDQMEHAGRQPQNPQELGLRTEAA